MSPTTAGALRRRPYDGCDGRVSVLAVLCDPSEEFNLVALLGHFHWSIHAVNDFRQALEFLRTSAVGVAVAQHEPAAGFSWRDLLEWVRSMNPSPRLIVTDRLADNAMWAEVLNLGAYDLLMQPFVPEEAFRVIHSAWLSWKRERDRRKPAPMVAA